MNADLIKRKLLVKYPSFGRIITNVEFIEDPTRKTAATNGKDVYYNPNFMDSITSDEQLFVFAHEICHIAFNHIYRSEGKDPKTWNKATDSVVNALLKADGLTMPEHGVNIPEAINYDAESMYEKLIKEKKNNSSNEENKKQNANSEQSNSSESGNSTESEDQNQNETNEQSQNDKGNSQNSSEQNDNHSDENQNNNTNNEEQNNEEENQDDNSSSDKEQDEEDDTHDLWKEAVEKKKQEQEESENEKIAEKYEKLGEHEVFKENKEERDNQLEELRKSLARKSTGHGTTTEEEKRTINDIGHSKPLIDWRFILRDSITYDVDWSYQNAEIEDYILRPYLEEQPRPETEIVLDTSGSINDVLLKNFLRECKNILQTSHVKVGCFDTKFYGFTDIRDESDIDNLQFIGSGGTDFNAAVNAFSRRAENKIIFTDGDADMPDKPMDAIWIVFGNRKINPPGGRVIYIDQEQLQRLLENSYGRRR